MFTEIYSPTPKRDKLSTLFLLANNSTSNLFKAINAIFFLLLSVLPASQLKAQASITAPTVTVCGYKVETKLNYNSPVAGQTTIVWTITNTNPGNGDNGTFQNLSHWSQEVCFTEANVVGSNTTINFKDPSQTCFQPENIFKLDKGTSGATPEVYELTLLGTNYSLGLVNAVFKSGASLEDKCCTGQVYGITCGGCVVDPGTINECADVCTGGDPAVISSTSAGTGTSYQWQSSTVSCEDGASFSDIDGATSATYDPPAGITQKTYYRRVSMIGDVCKAISNCVAIDIKPKTNPTFHLNDEICEGGTAPTLPLISDNGISGTWSPGTVSNTAGGTYTFTPNTDQCANGYQLIFVVNKKKDLTFDPIPAICSGGSFTLPPASKEGVTGTWSPAINNTATTEYTFTPDALFCANIYKLTVQVKPLPTLVVKDISNTCPASTANLTTAVVSFTAGCTISYFRSDCVTPVVPTAVGAGTYCIQVVKDGCKVTKLVTVTINLCPQGCTPGYWKNRKASWSTIKTTNDELNCINTAAITPVTGELKNVLFKDVFGLTDAQMIATLGSKSITLITAAGLGDGSGYTQLSRAATAALLNSCALVAFSNFAAYPYTTSQIVTETRAVFQMAVNATSRQAAIALAMKYDKANNSTCVLDNSAIKTASSPGVSATETIAVTQLAVSTFPNPYTDKIRFVVSNPKGGQGNLQVYNLLGQKIKTVFQGYIPAGNQTYEFVVPPTRRSNLVYVLSVGKDRITGQIVQAIK